MPASSAQRVVVDCLAVVRQITKTELNELLVDDAALDQVRYHADSRTATMTFSLDDASSSKVILVCRSVFQIVLVGYGAWEESPFGSKLTTEPVDMSAVLKAFTNQPIFEWTLDCDEPITRSGKGNQFFLVDEFLPPPPYRGIALFKDVSNSHFQVLLVGASLHLESGSFHAPDQRGKGAITGSSDGHLSRLE